MIRHLVSMSTGKDSVATALLALETQPRESVGMVFADTGNEHQIVYDHLAYLEEALGMPIVRLKADFSAEFDRKRRYVLEKWPDKGVSAAAVERAAALLTSSGNPFLDLCMLKGRFPSRKAQFCTQHLKTEPLVEYAMRLIEQGDADAVWSWQGVRIDESQSRRSRLQGTGACVKSFEVVGGGLFNYRPILRWTAADCFEVHRIFGIRPNPLYLQGMTRVGCMPCINASKDELLAISKRFPEEVARIAEWEQIVAQVSRRGEASFFPNPEREAHLDKRGIWKMVEWSKTSRGGVEFDMFRVDDEPAACSSAYGLCE